MRNQTNQGAPTPQKRATDKAREFDEPLFVSCIIAGGMGAGLLVPGLADALAPAVLSSLFVIVLSSLVPFRSMLSKQLLNLNGSLLRVVGWLQLALPVLVYTLSIVLNVPKDIVPFVLLSACSGAVFASPALAHLFGLDRGQAARIMILSTVLMPISLSIFVGPLVGLDNLLAFEAFGLRVAIFLLLPLLFVLVLRGFERVMNRKNSASVSEAASTRIDTYATRVGMMALAVFAAGIMQGVAEGWANDPGVTLALFAGALTVNLGMMFATRLALHPLGSDVAHTASIIAMTRNVGLAYAMTASFFGPSLAQYVALCQVPLLIGPVVMRLHKGATEARMKQREKVDAQAHLQHSLVTAERNAL
ncbi:MAG: hypothetical protein AAFO61_05310 [Pseudomonadota bacterium]